MIPDKIYNLLLIRYKKIKLGNGCKIQGKLICYGKAKKFQIGDNVRIVSCCKKNPLGGQQHTMFSLGEDSTVLIGDNTGISNSVFRIRCNLKIGDNVNIGGDCKFYDSDMHSLEYKNRISSNDSTIKKASIKIDDGVWIGAHSIILKGVNIGKRSVVAAGSVVTKSIPDDELWGGNPAHFIKKINI